MNNHWWRASEALQDGWICLFYPGIAQRRENNSFTISGASRWWIPFCSLSWFCWLCRQISFFLFTSLGIAPKQGNEGHSIYYVIIHLSISIFHVMFVLHWLINISHSALQKKSGYISLFGTSKWVNDALTRQKWNSDLSLLYLSLLFLCCSHCLAPAWEIPNHIFKKN